MFRSVPRAAPNSARERLLRVSGARSPRVPSPENGRSAALRAHSQWPRALARVAVSATAVPLERNAMPRSRRAYARPLAACILAGTALGLSRPMHSLAPFTWTSKAPDAPHRLYRLKDDEVRIADLAFGRGGQLRGLFADPLRPGN